MLFMALDGQTQKIVDEVCGQNVYRQLIHVVPEFFERFVLLQMVPKPGDKQHAHYPHIVLLEEKIRASTDPLYVVGETVDLQYHLGDLCQQGLYVLVSPLHIRTPRLGAFDETDELFTSRPYDSLVIAEVPADGISHFGEPDVFYAHSARLSGGREIHHGGLSFRNFSEGICKLYVHFAFVPRKEEGRESTFINRFTS